MQRAAKHRSYAGNSPRLHARMVNGGFPPAHRYGFELVDRADCSRARPSIENLPDESDAADFSRNFGELSPLQSLAIYREWPGEMGCAHPRNPPRRDCSEIANVLSAAHVLLARAGARAAAAGQDA